MTHTLNSLFANPPPAGYTDTSGGPTAGDPVLGWLLIAAAVAVFVFLAWVAARIGDADRAPY